ncbi:hypothetical protein M419DRAFT_128849 [Trichoderma reesei RUT C-30]|uniref:Uncharacterized protein n=1 Tax=Hypocrea jecorina (strain ATCC 56765 / BCRC 32924 / NRRL 11460 / Rut C-30) TaxID=1344414 RepID=A0A024SH89_HYPJR|nr:hypothetical protein M419DRAFT_128849 [Trichoderma reesei RUT C-30]
MAKETTPPPSYEAGHEAPRLVSVIAILLQVLALVQVVVVALAPVAVMGRLSGFPHASPAEEARVLQPLRPETPRPDCIDDLDAGSPCC